MDLQNVSQDVDRISSLPEPLLHHILSYLPTQNVVQTCILSKKWAHLWCSVPYLNFNMESHQSTTQGKNHLHSKFSKFIDSVLIRRYGSNVESFRLHTSDDDDDDEESIDMTSMSSWIIFALRHNVQVLDLEYDSDKLPHAIGRSLFMSTSLKELRLDFQSFTEDFEVFPIPEVPNLVLLPSLTILFLKGLEVKNGDKLSQMLSSCPSLHTLSIVRCCIFGWFTISMMKLKSISLMWVFGLDDGFVQFKISAPSLVSLNSTTQKSMWSIDDCPFLVDANIVISFSTSRSMDQLVRALSKVEFLTISTYYTVDYGREYGVCLHEWVQTPLNSLKFLKLEILFSENDVELVTLLRFCPNIETLVLKNNGEMRDWKPESKGNVKLKEELSHLKVVKFYNFRGSENEVKCIELLFNKAKNLEKMIIVAPEFIQGSERNKLLADIPKILLKYPGRPTSILIDASSASVSCVFV